MNKTVRKKVRHYAAYMISKCFSQLPTIAQNTECRNVLLNSIFFTLFLPLILQCRKDTEVTERSQVLW